MDTEMRIRAFKALGDPTRWHIVEFLSGMCCGIAALDESGGVEGPTAGEVCCHITGQTRINSTISHHLHELEAAGLIQIERNGKRMVCSLKRSVLQELSQALTSTAEATESQCCPTPAREAVACC